MKPRLLLLCPTKTYRAEAFVRAARRLPADLSIASEEPSALSHLHPDALPAFDFDNAERAAEFARQFHREYPIHAVVPVDDQATMAAAAIAEALDLAGNPPAAIAAATDKFLMREHMHRAGLDVPEYRRLAIDEVADEGLALPAFPAVVKPLAMSASRGVIRVNNPDEFRQAVGRVANIVKASGAIATPGARGTDAALLVESYVPGWEVAVEGILSHGALDVFTIFDKPDPLEGPYFPETLYVYPSRLPRASQERVIELTREAIRAVGLTHGPVHAELRGNRSGVTLIEIAARSIGGLCSKVLRFRGGLSLEDVILRHAIELLPVIPETEPGAAGVLMLQAPRAGTFVEVRGVEKARATPAVDEIDIVAYSGQTLEPLPEGSLYVGFVFARAETPEAVETALRHAGERIEVVLDGEAK